MKKYGLMALAIVAIAAFSLAIQTGVDTETITNLVVTGDATFDATDASTVPIINADGKLDSSTVTPTTLEFMDATSSVQDQLDTAQSTADDHIADTSDAHDASAISVLDTGDLLAATDVEAALAEIAGDADTAQSTADDHIADTSDAHDASAISVLDTGDLLAATDAEAAFAEIAGDADTAQSTADDHIADTSDAHDASAISVLDTGDLLAATDVEAALAEIAGDADTAQSTANGKYTAAAMLVASGANTACATTCTTHTCFGGFDADSAMVPVACDSAAADHCFCYND